jgi:hypothetical protein
MSYGKRGLRGLYRIGPCSPSVLARDHAYGLLPPPSGQGVYLLDAGYLDAAVQDVRIQLSRAGVRLAAVLNKALGRAPERNG